MIKKSNFTKKSKPLGHDDISGARFVSELGIKSLSPLIDSFMVNNNTIIAFHFKPYKVYKLDEIDKNTAFFFSDIVNKNPGTKVYYYDGNFDSGSVSLKRYLFQTTPDKKLIKPEPLIQKMSISDFSRLFRSFSKLVLQKNEINKNNLQAIANNLSEYKPINSGSYDRVFDFYYNLGQKEPTASFNVDLIHYTNSKHVLIELLKCESTQKTITPHSSHPNRYMKKNYQKFLSIYNLAKMLDADVILVNYAEARTSYQDYVGVIHSFKKDNQEIIDNIIEHRKLGKKFIVNELNRVSFKELYENKVFKEKVNASSVSNIVNFSETTVIKNKNKVLSLKRENN